MNFNQRWKKDFNKAVQHIFARKNCQKIPAGLKTRKGYMLAKEAYVEWQQYLTPTVWAAT